MLAFHLPQRVEVLRRLWAAVAPGGHLLVQDYDLRTCRATPAVPEVDAAVELMNAAFDAFGCQATAGAMMPRLFAEAGIGDPDGGDVAGRIEPLAQATTMLTRTLSRLLPGAIAKGVTTPEQAAATLAGLERAASAASRHAVTWPLLIGTWKRRTSG